MYTYICVYIYVPPRPPEALYSPKHLCNTYCAGFDITINHLAEIDAFKVIFHREETTGPLGMEQNESDFKI